MEPLHKLTVLAMYAIHFAENQQQYAMIFSRLATEESRENLTPYEEVKAAARQALDLYKPTWGTKGNIRKKIVPQEEIDKLKQELAQAKNDYKNAELAGGQLTMKLRKERIERLRKELSSLGSKEDL